MKNRALGTQTQDCLEPTNGDPSRRASGVQARARLATSEPPLSAAAQSQRPVISIDSPADPALLETTYAYLSAYTAHRLPPRVADRLNVAVYELLANALRYGSGEVRLELQLNPSGSGAVLRVSNQAEPAQLERLRAQLDAVWADAAAAFTTEMNRFGSGSEPAPMLGLVRIAHESSLALEARYEGTRVELVTSCEG